MENLAQTRENWDAAQRISDTVSLHMVAASNFMDAVGKWCVFKLEDGRSDGHIYDSKDDAIRHQQGDPKHYCYLKITPDGITTKDAWHFLKINRNPFIDSTSPEHVINPYVYERFSNLTKAQKFDLLRRVKEENHGR